ncbi:Interleukin-1 receptor accessory protein-like 1 [Frankliniella fusca]|uniref:Interleukin-1 receptor accessory protein-like 1 n=1 Tax=Frankliniella fusca TaxID=407009 RepID=A0AAE1HH51_9NEOP|nr:Interleukin-1 receptor accessory protein-like 1 [Frankliniella fusca]
MDGWRKCTYLWQTKIVVPGEPLSYGEQVLSNTTNNTISNAISNALSIDYPVSTKLTVSMTNLSVAQNKEMTRN